MEVVLADVAGFPRYPYRKVVLVGEKAEVEELACEGEGTENIVVHRDLEDRLREKYPIRLAIFGYGDEGYRRRLQEIADRLGLQQNFLLGPRLPQELVFEYLSLSELGLVTYERNPLTELTVPNKVFEYAAARKPLVIADLRTLRRLFNGAALFYRPGDAEDLANKMQRLLDDAAGSPR